MEPTVYLLAWTCLERDAVLRWLKDLRGERVLSTLSGGGAEMLVELAGRRCYRSFDAGLNPNVTKVRTDSRKYHRNILDSRHGSVLEHVSTTWAFEGVSRVFTHELVRNRAGNAFSQESLRYVRLSEDLQVWKPPEIHADRCLSDLFDRAVAAMQDWQKGLADASGIDAMTDFACKKKLTSAFRRIAPMGLSTGIVFSANMRSLRWVIEQRTSRHAEYEMRLVFNRVAGIASAKWPYFFQDFTSMSVDGLPEWVPANSKV